MPPGEQLRPLAPLSFNERAHSYISQPIIRIALIGVTLALIGGYFFGSRSGSAAPQRSPSSVTTDSTITHPTTTTLNTEIKVYVTGEVASPGVVDLPAKSRVGDAIAKAGNATSSADLTKCNLAAFIADGSAIVVPSTNAPGNCSGQSSTSSTDIANTGSSSSGGSPEISGQKINLNTAAQSEIETLVGVGPVMASAIIAYRTQHGGFSSINDLRKVKGIGDKRFSDLKDLVTI